jgi:transcriptional antiterminator RfaH
VVDLMAETFQIPVETSAIGSGEAGPVPGSAAPDEGRDAGSAREADGPVPPQWSPALPNCWLTVHHRADSGAQVRLALRRLGIEVHWPRLVVRRPRQDDVLRPLFPGYCFAAMDPTRQSWSHLKVDKVLGLVGVREYGRPTALRNGEVEALISMAGDAIDGVIGPTQDARPIFRQGDRLRVVAGPFAGLLATFKGDRPQDRVAVLMEVLGKAAIDLPRHYVERIGGE